MKTYITPEIALVSFTPDKSIAASAAASNNDAGSNIFNDVEFAW